MSRLRVLPMRGVVPSVHGCRPVASSTLVTLATCDRSQSGLWHRQPCRSQRTCASCRPSLAPGNSGSPSGSVGPCCGSMSESTLPFCRNRAGACIRSATCTPTTSHLLDRLGRHARPWTILRSHCSICSGGRGPWPSSGSPSARRLTSATCSGSSWSRPIGAGSHSSSHRIATSAIFVPRSSATQWGSRGRWSVCDTLWRDTALVRRPTDCPH